MGFTGKNKILTQMGLKAIDTLVKSDRVPSYDFSTGTLFMSTIKSIHMDYVYIDELQGLLLYNSTNPKLVKKVVNCKYDPILIKIKDDTKDYVKIDIVNLKKDLPFYSIQFTTNNVKDDWRLYGIQDLSNKEAIGRIPIYNIELKVGSNIFIDSICFPSYASKPIVNVFLNKE